MSVEPRGAAFAFVLGVSAIAAAATPDARRTHPVAFEATRLEGPFAELGDYCENGPPREVCNLGGAEAQVDPRVTARLSAPFMGLEALTTSETCAQDDPWACRKARLGLEVGGKWWVLPLGDAGGHDASYRVTAVSGVGHRLLVRYAFTEGHHGGTYQVGVLVCGVGESGVPSCYGPLATTESEWEEGGDPSKTTLRVSLRCHAELVVRDILVIDRQRDRERGDFGAIPDGPPASCRGMREWGRHQVVFP
jgi:hypothetical protein